MVNHTSVWIKVAITKTRRFGFISAIKIRKVKMVWNVQSDYVNCRLVEGTWALSRYAGLIEGWSTNKRLVGQVVCYSARWAVSDQFDIDCICWCMFELELLAPGEEDQSKVSVQAVPAYERLCYNWFYIRNPMTCLVQFFFLIY